MTEYMLFNGNNVTNTNLYIKIGNATLKKVTEFKFKITCIGILV